MPEYYISNYHSKKALAAAVAAGKTVKLIHLPLTQDQLKQNSIAKATGEEPPFILHTPPPFSTHEIQGSFNKEVPFYTATIDLNEQCNVSKVY